MIIDFSSLPDENLLVGTLVNRCAELYEASPDCEDAGYHGTFDKKHFLIRRQDYGDGSERYASSSNKFYIPENIKDNFNCAIECSSAQLIIELR